MDLTEDTRRWLLGFARRTIESFVSGAKPETTTEPPPGVELLCGCFVSLHRQDGSLRGCIGTFAEDAPLWRNVRDMAIAAATRDPRFSPVSRDELAACQLEISVLSPRWIAEPTDVVVGKHGINVTKGVRRGVLLPQVAVSHAWDRETFLSQTCFKAGLAGDAWRDGSVTIELFTADVFSEP